ncbi:MAG: hypothetical protein IMF02_04215 [Proteobacteria bacterium]|nr:hypothetical protein [Pseudomonadota bacterium]
MIDRCGLGRKGRPPNRIGIVLHNQHHLRGGQAAPGTARIPANYGQRPAPPG